MKKAEHQKIDAFELWCWRRLLRAPWTVRRSNQPILKEVSPGCSLEGLMLKLKLQDFGHLMQRVDALEKTLMLGGIGGSRRRGWQRMRWLDAITDSWAWVWVNSGICDGQGDLACCDSWVAKSWTGLSDWTELNLNMLRLLHYPTLGQNHLTQAYFIIKCKISWVIYWILDWKWKQNYCISCLPFW